MPLIREPVWSAALSTQRTKASSHREHMSPHNSAAPSWRFCSCRPFALVHRAQRTHRTSNSG